MNRKALQIPLYPNGTDRLNSVYLFIRVCLPCLNRYPRLMYYKDNHVYWYHRKKYSKDFNYRDFIPMFMAEKFEVLTLLLFFFQSTHKNHCIIYD